MIKIDVRFFFNDNLNFTTNLDQINPMEIRRYIKKIRFDIYDICFHDNPENFLKTI